MNLVKLREFLNQLRNYKLLRKDSALWSLSFRWVIQTNDDLKFVLLCWIYETDKSSHSDYFPHGKVFEHGRNEGSREWEMLQNKFLIYSETAI